MIGKAALKLMSYLELLPEWGDEDDEEVEDVDEAEEDEDADEEVDVPVELLSADEMSPPTVLTLDPAAPTPFTVTAWPP